MSGSPAAPTPPLSPAEMQVLIGRAGLTLNPGQIADLVLAWRQIVGLLGLIPRDRPLRDDQAFVFRVPSPAAPAKPAVTSRPPPSMSRKTAAPAARKTAPGPARKEAPQAGKSTGKKTAARPPKATAPRAAKKAVPRKPVRRRR